MPTFNHQGLSLAYDDVRPAGAAQRTVVLIHGYAANRRVTWSDNGWPQAFAARGVRTLALDQRGHGDSDKPHDLACYARTVLGADVNALLDHLEIARADLMGHSLGSRVAIEAAFARPHRVTGLVLTAAGANLVNLRSDEVREAMGAAMLAADPQSIADGGLRAFRRFAQAQGEDLAAMSAFTRADRTPLDTARLATLAIPVLVASGARDRVGDPSVLSRLFPRGRSVVLPACDHFSVLKAEALKTLVFDFLGGAAAG